MEIVGSIAAAYKFTESYYESSYVQRRIPLFEKFAMTMRRYVYIYTSPYYRVIEDELLVTDIGNDTILHIIRLMVMYVQNFWIWT